MEKTQIENIKAAAMIQFMSLGIRSVSMDDISSDLGISKKTLYKYFSNKNELVDTCITNFIEQEKKLMDHLKEESVDAIDEMRQLAQHIISIFRTTKPILLNDLQKYYKTVWQKIKNMQTVYIRSQMSLNIERGINEGYYRQDIDSDIISNLYVHKAWVISDYMNEFHGDKMEKIFEQHFLYHLYGMLSEKGINHFQKINLFKN